MEDKLKNILKKHNSFADLNESERLQLLEWCADEQEFQSLKKLFQQVDVWSDQNTDESNTKMRLDQLFAIQYAGKQAQSGGREIRFVKNRFSRLATLTSISAVAAALVVTWLMYQPNKEVSLAKNDVKKSTQEKKGQSEIQKDVKLTEDLSNTTPIAVESSNEETPKEIVSTEVISQNLSLSVADVETVVPAVTWSNSLANGTNATLSSTPLGATTYSWNVGNLSEVQVESSSMTSKGKISSRKKQADEFTSFSVKTMPEMLDVIVAAY
jgi:hypothetical protein